MTRDEVKIKLVKLHKTQRWLLAEVKKRGYSTMHEPIFSDILNGKYHTEWSDGVMKAAEQVLSKEESA